MLKNPLRANAKGFTIVELLIVIVVIGILAAIAIIGFNGMYIRAKESALKHSLSNAAKAVKLYGAGDFAENFPLALNDVNIKSTETTLYQYSVNNTASPKTFCITATTETLNFYFSSTNNQLMSGLCPGHGFKTALGWSTFPLPWSTSSSDRGYGLYYGVYYPSTLRADNSGSLTLFNPLAAVAAQGGVNVYMWCRNTSSNVIGTAIVGQTFATFDATTSTNTVTWSCPAGTLLYALNIGSTNPGGSTPDSLTGTVKDRTWYAPQSPNYKASQPYTLPNLPADPAGWVTMPLPWSTGTDLGYGPYYGVYIANDSSKNLSAIQTNILQLYNPYSNTRPQGGVDFYYWCKNNLTGLVGNYNLVTFPVFNSVQTQQVTWTCPIDAKLFAATIGSTMTSNYYPNEIASKTRFWFSGEKVQANQSYIESIRLLYGE